jgi:hypothetical protein
MPGDGQSARRFFSLVSRTMVTLHDSTFQQEGDPIVVARESVRLDAQTVSFVA